MVLPYSFRSVSTVSPVLSNKYGVHDWLKKTFLSRFQHPVCAVRGTGELKKRSQIESNEILHFRSTSEKSELYLLMQLQVIAIVRQGIEKLQELVLLL